MRLPLRLSLRCFGLVIAAWALAGGVALRAATYYVATDGNDANPGTLASPFATIQRGQTAAVAGDTVYIRGGTYVMTEAQIATRVSIWAYVTHLTKSGSYGARINYWAYPGERPVFDYSNIKPADLRVIAFFVSGSWLHIRGLEIIGVQVTILTHTQSECFENQGSNNIYEQLSMHDGMAIGVYFTRGSNNLILNCDAYRNWDSVSEGGRGGNVDGFGGHPRAGATGNVFRGCRAWFNSDDGFDSINAFESVTVEYCQAFFNGYTPDFVSRGDGNGFKTGGYGAAGGAFPTPVPRHVTNFSLAVRNKVNGFYGNHHIGGSDWVGNTAYQNATNYNMLSVLADNDTDVPGYGHYMRNNLGYEPRSNSLTNIDQAQCDVASNFFTLPVTVTTADFVATTTNTAQLEAFVSQARQADGALPEISLLKLAAGSDLVDAGADAGFPFSGAAPDLGAFEAGAEAGRRALTWQGGTSGNAWDLNSTANWRHGSTAAKFGPTDLVLLDNAGAANASISLVGTLWPGALLVKGGQNYSLAGTGALAGAMTLTMSGTGTLSVAGAHVYTGATRVLAGTLRVTGSLTGTASVEVAAGATLELTGTITSATVTIRAGGRLTGGGTIRGALINEGEITGDGPANVFSVDGPVTNRWLMRFTRGAGFSTSGVVENLGTLDVITAGAVPPAGRISGTGVVLTASGIATPRLERMDGGLMRISLPSVLGHGYQFQRSLALETAQWMNLGEVVSGTGGELVRMDMPPEDFSRVFYRGLIWP